MTTMTEAAVSVCRPRLKRALAANAAFSGLTGVIAVAAAETLIPVLFTSGDWEIGLSAATVLRVLGIGLCLFAAGVAWTARQPHASGAMILLICGLDAAWVVASAGLVVFAGAAFTGLGLILVVAVALLVALFAGAQTVAWRGIREVTRVR